MKLDPNDPRLTAYALGELDEAEQEAIERDLAHSEAARQTVVEIRATAELLREEFSNEPGLQLSEAQRSLVERKVQAGKRRVSFAASRSLYAGGALLAAASLFLAVYVNWSAMGKSPDSWTGTARNNQILGPGTASPTNAVQNPSSISVTDRNHQVQQPSGQGHDKNRVAQMDREKQGAAIGTELIARNEAVSQPQLAFDQNIPAGIAPSSSVATRPLSPAIPKPTAGPGLGHGSGGGVGAGSAGGVAMGHFGLQQRFVSMNALSEVDGLDSDELKTLGDKARLKMAEALQRYRQDFNTEAYDRVVDNPFLRATQNPLSTFSIDVDTAAYANLRRFLSSGALPPKDSVRIEEMVNYFSYNYPNATHGDPFSTQVEVASAPWKPEHRLVKIGIKGREIAQDKRPPSNLVFLIDVSGSMQPPNKLPLIKRGLPLLVQNLTENDRVAIVVYAGASGLVLPSTTCDHKAKILAALEHLEAGGSTNGGSGIQLAYDTAIANLIKGGTNRVILATDGDFNVGVTNQGELTRLIEEKAKSGVFLSVLGFGMGNYKDSTLEKLADKGNGNYAYVDSLQEARKVLVEQMGGTLITIAKDVKIQVEFNPALVGAYRLIGYENRILRAEDFNDDTKDAGEIGAGHTVTALYEVAPAGKEGALPGVDALKYQKPVEAARESKSGELLTLKLRYKEPDGTTSKLMQVAVSDRGTNWTQSSRDFKFASAVAALGMVLRDSPYKGNATVGSVLELAEAGKGEDRQGYRAEFIELVRTARGLVEGRKVTD
jgi:Ca-activated chloride channel homolog